MIQCGILDLFITEEAMNSGKELSLQPVDNPQIIAESSRCISSHNTTSIGAIVKTEH